MLSKYCEADKGESIPYRFLKSKANWIYTLRFAFISPIVNDERKGEQQHHLRSDGAVFANLNRPEEYRNESQRLTERVL